VTSGGRNRRGEARRRSEEEDGHGVRLEYVLYIGRVADGLEDKNANVFFHGELTRTLSRVNSI
jgi:hypothetical protein